MMAALTASRVAWSRVGVTGANPVLWNFHRKIHKRSDLLMWRRVKSPFLPRLDPANGSHYVLFGPVIRCQSTAAVTGTEVVEPPTSGPIEPPASPPIEPPASPPIEPSASIPIEFPASPPIETLLSTGDLSQASHELTIAELGLGSSTPVGLIQNLLEFLHVNMHLPWWGAIITGTVLVRCMIFPLIVKGQREAVKLNNHMPKITELTNDMNEAKRSGNKYEFAKAYSDLLMYQKAHNVNPLRGFIVPLVQMPIFLSYYFALRKMAELPVPSLQTGGLWWFSDLTAADPYYILPLTVTATMWAILELGAESGVSNPNIRTMKVVFRVMPLVILPLTISFPTAIFTYWVTSNVFSLMQVTVLRIPAVRTRLGIQELKQQDPGTSAPQEGFVESLKKGWKNAQLGHKMKEREMRIKNHLEMAARGPLRQTFRHNPLEQHAPATKPQSNKRPWEDSLG